MATPDIIMEPDVNIQDTSTGSSRINTRCHRHTSSSSSFPAPPSATATTTKAHRRRFSIQTSSASSSSSSSSSNNNRDLQPPNCQQHRHLTQNYATPHGRSQPAAATMAGPSPSFFRRIFKAFVGIGGAEQQHGHSNGPRQSRINPSDRAAVDGSTYSSRFYDHPPQLESQTDESGSCEECECNCGDHINSNSGDCKTLSRLYSPRQQSKSASRQKKRSNSMITTTSATSATSQQPGRSAKSIRPGRAASIGGASIHSYCAAHSASGSSGYGSGSAKGASINNRRSSVTSSIAGESIHYDLGTNSRKSGDKNRIFMNNNQQYRQHFTGHGYMSTTPAINANQQDSMKRRLSFFKSVATGASSTSRRGSAFSTKSQETAVNLTGINPADEFEDDAGYDEEYEGMDLDEEDEGDDDFDDFNDLNECYDYNEDEAMSQGQDYYTTHDSMLTADVELELHHRRQAAMRLSTRRLRHLRRLRRQSLLSDNNNLLFRNKSGGGCVVCAAPLIECKRRPSPIQLPEILHLIFQFVVDMTPADDYSQREIYNCLLVSKQWYLVAQKTLWREIRFKNPTKLELFIDLLKRTETVECLGIERNSQSQRANSTQGAIQSQPQLQQRRASVVVHGQQGVVHGQQGVVHEDESIMSPIAMQKRLYERASSVKKIVLHKLKLIEDKDILPLTTWFHNLQILEFYICEKLTDRIVVAVAENCPRLQQLLMPGCAKITDSGISQVALHCPRMKHLDLRACSNVSDESLFLVAKHCPELWHLNVGRVSSATKVTGRSIVEIAKNTKLNTLGLAGCAMTDDAVIEIARYSRLGLHRISLNSCPMLTCASIRALMQLCPNLAVLEIKQCLLITDMATLYRFSTRRVLVELCPELQKRLLEYKVELAAMNASIQSNNIASTAGSSGWNGQSTTQAATGHNDNGNSNGNNSGNSNASSNVNSQNNDNSTTQQPTTTTVVAQQ
ncbi:hypothetical protein EDD21DRAFT_414763 [Dissophora ornata]|nr:hypothetical protein EDD21DRAFT_414763 [Dissophora ornata]